MKYLVTLLVLQVIIFTTGAKAATMTEKILYHGRCDCGQVRIGITAEPLFTQICHCNQCRDLAALSKTDVEPVGYAHTVALMSKHFKILAGEDKLEEHAGKTSYRYLCSNCKVLIYGVSQDPEQRQGMGINRGVFTAVDQILSEAFQPIRHVYYVDRIIDISDGLPKFKDFPSEIGGTGIKVES